MTDKPVTPPGEPAVPCAACLKEVPLGTAFTPEGVDYVEHFCGIGCHRHFIAEAKRRGAGAPGSGA
ncbi:MAG: hypothetical protein EFKGCFLK_02305 [Rhodocyclaceae bacterium]|nr:MAG: DUF3330 domain-containing protein [Rhodocyclaceae bacterium]MBE7421319.1 DUF3330 domain-containing protein [Zoogloeaceae bacterium]MBV6408704.1 hypothetical protein [Rhodocyclaceae bacterium]MCK6385005.1 DUF3330 domain-containing protein [Rhodocyclaceae bacterium]